jgi:hypothetical protein
MDVTKKGQYLVWWTVTEVDVDVGCGLQKFHTCKVGERDPKIL